MLTPPTIRVRRWLADGTRRFAQRPVFGTDDIELAVAELTAQYFESRDVQTRCPWSDDDLARLVEGLTSEFDSACDLSYISEDVEGATQFSFDNAPVVLIEKRLATEKYRRRRRMTIAHEIGHVVAHRQLFQRSSSEMMELFTDLDGTGPIYCLRESIVRGDDWMEWQASYFGASLLMPRSDVLAAVASEYGGAPHSSTLLPSSDAAHRAISAVADAFDISLEAARVRLIELRVIEPNDSVLRLPLR